MSFDWSITLCRNISSGPGRKWFPQARHDIATTYITYLSYNTFNTGNFSGKEAFEDRLKEYPLYDYAARNWGHHSRLQRVDESSIMALLEDRAKASACARSLGIYLGNGRSYHRPHGRLIPQQYGEHFMLRISVWTP